MSVSLHTFRKEEESPEKVSLSYHETTSYSEDAEESVSVPFVRIGIATAIFALIIIAIIIISVLRFIRGDWFWNLNIRPVARRTNRFVRQRPGVNVSLKL